MSEPAARLAREHIEEIHSHGGHEHGVLGKRARWTAILIAVLAAVLAVADLSAHRAAKTIITSKSAAGSIATQYEAVDNHRTTLENDRLLLDALGAGDTSPVAVKARGEAKAFATREAASLTVQERKLEKKRDALESKAAHADERYSDLEIGIGALQMAIVLASVSIVAATWLLGVGVGAGIIGLFFTVYAIAST
ncbi:MAG: DUF4337 family protein [Mycobacteriales bacterium]